MAEQPDVVLAGLVRALPEYVDANRRLTTVAAEQHGQNWRKAADVVGRYAAAVDSGATKARMDAIVELTQLPLMQNPVNRRLLEDIEKDVSAAQPGVLPTSEAYRRAVWQEYAVRATAPDVDPTTLGTLQAVREKYPPGGLENGDPVGVYFTDRDSLAYKNYARISAMAQRQAEAANQMKGLRDQALGVIQATGGDAELLDSYLRQPEYALLGNSKALRAVQAFAAETATAPPALVGEAKEQYDRNQVMRLRIEDMVTKSATTETRRDRIARIVASPSFQWWAESNGFDVGKVIPKDATGDDHTHGKGVETPVGIYIPGADDEAALAFANKQNQRGANPVLDMLPWRHRRTPGAAAYGQVQVRYGVLPDESAKVDGAYYYTDTEEGRRYYAADELTEAAAHNYRQAALDRLRALPAAKDKSEAELEAAADAAVAQYPMTAADRDQHLQGITKSATPPAESVGQVFTGKVLAPRAGDAIGTVRMRTASGTKVFTPDQLMSPLKITSGGGTRQNVATLVDRVAGRVAANIEEKRRDEPPIARAEVAAMALVPERYGKGDKQAVADRREDEANAKQKSKVELARTVLAETAPVPYTPSGAAEAAAMKGARASERAADPANVAETFEQDRTQQKIKAATNPLEQEPAAFRDWYKRSRQRGPAEVPDAG